MLERSTSMSVKAAGAVLPCSSRPALPRRVLSRTAGWTLELDRERVYGLGGSHRPGHARLRGVRGRGEPAPRRCGTSTTRRATATARDMNGDRRGWPGPAVPTRRTR
ncbi:hypothetical protein LT493_10340 [Streptomyces tricolor]|nr:hypothetical protein [Streptomyces tricolor]